MLRIPLPEYDGFALHLSKQLTVNREGAQRPKLRTQNPELRGSGATAPTALALPQPSKKGSGGISATA